MDIKEITYRLENDIYFINQFLIDNNMQSLYESMISAGIVLPAQNEITKEVLLNRLNLLYEQGKQQLYTQIVAGFKYDNSNTNYTGGMKYYFEMKAKQAKQY